MSTLPSDPKARKDLPLVSGLLDYFPGALAAVAEVSRVANEQHNPGEEMHWAREKSADHADCIVRHLVDRGRLDSDGLRHSAKIAWRALALLQTELEEAGAEPGRASRFAEERPKPPFCPSVAPRDALGAKGFSWMCEKPGGHTGLHGTPNTGLAKGEWE